MTAVSGPRAWLAVALLAGAPPTLAAAPAAAGFAPLAHSALLTVEGAVTDDTLTLRVHATQAQAALAVTGLSVSIDGRAFAAARLPDGTWAVPLAALPAHSPGKLELLVSHDGVREVLAATLPAASPAPGAGFAGASNALRQHKQMAWWILNVVVVLIGVIAVSRRMS